MPQDISYMLHALNLARRNLGQVWPNPAVGAVIVKDGFVVGRGWTQRGGRPHAETQAIAQAGSKSREATMFVSLEPCAHQGQTPPCAQAIIKAGLKRVVVACRDPDPRVNGKGIELLKAASVEVTEGVCEVEARALNCGFFSKIERDRPWITLKIATSADGKIHDPKRRWITGEQARGYGHLLRAEHDAILTGIGTVLADDPLLTCRLPGMEDRSPVRVVIDREGRLPVDSALVRSAARVPLWILRPDAAKPGPELERALKTLSEQGITRLLVEGGERITESFLQAGLVDELYWFRAPMVVAGGGFSFAIEPSARYKLKESLPLGQDTLEIYACSPDLSPI